MEDDVLMALKRVFYYFSSEKSLAPSAPFAVIKANRKAAKPTEKKKTLIVALQ